MSHAQTKLRPNQADLIGNLPIVGSTDPAFVLTGNDMSDKQFKDFVGKTVVLNIFPSIDTGVCATSTRKFNQYLSTLQNTVVLCVSKDLPFAFKRFCGAEGIDRVVTLSDFRSRGFGKYYGVHLA